MPQRQHYGSSYTTTTPSVAAAAAAAADDDDDDDDDDHGGGYHEGMTYILNAYDDVFGREPDVRFPYAPGLYFDSDSDGSENVDEDEDEETGEFDSFIDSRPESEISGEGPDDTDRSIPYHTRENNYYTQVDTSDIAQGNSDEDDSDHHGYRDDDDEDEDEVTRILPGPIRRRIVASDEDTSERSEADSNGSVGEGSGESDDTVCGGSGKRLYNRQRARTMKTSPRAHITTPARPARQRPIIFSDQE